MTTGIGKIGSCNEIKPAAVGALVELIEQEIVFVLTTILSSFVMFAVSFCKLNVCYVFILLIMIACHSLLDHELVSLLYLT